MQRPLPNLLPKKLLIATVGLAALGVALIVLPWPVFFFEIQDGANPDISIGIDRPRTSGLHGPFELVGHVKAKRSLAGPVHVWFELPSTITYVAGDMDWTGELKAGETHVLKATVAPVVNGVASIDIEAKWPNPENIDGYDYASGAVFSLSFKSSEPGSGNDTGPSYNWTPGDQFVGDRLVNTGKDYRLQLVPNQSEVGVLTNQGLPGVPDVMAKALGKSGGVFALAFYGPQELTTGYHVAMTRITLGQVAYQIYPEVDRNQNDLFVIDAVATKPGADWPVVQKDVSPVYVRYFSYTDFNVDPANDTAMFIFRVNGQEVGRYTFSESQFASQPVQDLPLQPFEAVLPSSLASAPVTPGTPTPQP